MTSPAVAEADITMQPSRLRVLIAEDEPLSRMRLVRSVQRLGHEVRATENGSEAWEAFAAHGADVIITDWVMPDVDGPELCRRVRADAARPYTYVIFSTVLEGDDHVTQALAAGADDYLIKPTSLEEIEARLIVAARVTALHRERSAALSHRDTLLQVARDFAAEADPDRIVSAALAKVVRLLGVEHATLWYWDAADRVFTTARSTLWSGLRRLRLDQEHGLGQCVAATRRPMRVVDYAVEHPDDGLFVEAGMRSALAVPLHASDRLVGVLEAGSRVAGRGFSLAECETLELLAASLSSTLS